MTKVLRYKHRPNRKEHHNHNGDHCEECGRFERSLRKSPINYFSDLFITAMVLMWIFDNVYQSFIASAVTISSIVLSFKTGVAIYDTSMWSSIGTNVAIPLSCGGAIWMIKNSVQHAIAYSKGKRACQDFPKIDGAENFEVETSESQIEVAEIQEEMNSDSISTNNYDESENLTYESGLPFTVEPIEENSTYDSKESFK